MKRNLMIALFLLVLGVVPLASQAAPNTSNYMEQGGANWVIGGNLYVEDSNGRRNSYAKQARAVYEVDSGTGEGAVGAHGLGVYLPADAIVRQAWFQIVEQFTDNGSGTIALSCATANDIYSAADITGQSANAIIAGVPTGVAATMFHTEAGCELTATVATASHNAGKLVLFVDYVVSED